jgi:hypothetical protein
LATFALMGSASAQIITSTETDGISSVNIAAMVTSGAIQDWTYLLYPGDYVVQQSPASHFSDSYTLDNGQTSSGFGVTGTGSGGISFTYTGGTQYFYGSSLTSTPTITTTPGGDNSGTKSYFLYNGTGIASSLTLAGTGTETLNFYLENYDATSTFNFTLTTATGTGIALPTASQSITGVAASTAQVGVHADFAVTLTGIVAGDVLSFNDVATNVQSNGSVGIGGITATYAVPEPSTYAMMAGGLVFLLACQRFQRRGKGKLS